MLGKNVAYVKAISLQYINTCKARLTIGLEWKEGRTPVHHDLTFSVSEFHH